MMEIRTEKLRHTRWIYWVVALSMAGIGTVPLFFKTLFRDTSTFAIVNGIPITSREYQRAVVKEQDLRRLVHERFGSSARMILEHSLGRTESPEQTALMALAEAKICVGIARSIPVTLSSSFALSELRKPHMLQGLLQEELPASLYDSNGALRHDILRKYLERRGMNTQEFENMVDEALLRQTVVQLLAWGVTAPSWYLTEGLARISAPRTLALETVRFEPLRSRIAAEITEEAVKAYWADENRRAQYYWAPERRSGTVWTIELSRIERPAEEKRSAADLFRATAEHVLLEGQQETLDRYLEELGARRSALTKIAATAHQGKPGAARTLFEIERVGERSVATDGTHGYIVELQETSPRTELGYEEVAEKVKGDYERSLLKKAAQAMIKDKDATVARTTIQLGADEHHNKALEDVGFDVEQVRALAIPGAALEASTDSAAARVTVVAVGTPDAHLLEKHGGAAKARASMGQAYEQFVLDDLIDYLKEHAILTSMQS